RVAGVGGRQGDKGTRRQGEEQPAGSEGRKRAASSGAPADTLRSALRDAPEPTPSSREGRADDASQAELEFLTPVEEPRVTAAHRTVRSIIEDVVRTSG